MPSIASRAVNVALCCLIKRRLRDHLSVDAVRGAAGTLERLVARGALTTPGDPVDAPGVRGEWFTPDVADEQRILLYLHGGGFMTHLPAAYRAFARRLAGALGAQVFLPDYQLAPEHPFPAGLDDCLDAYGWLLAQRFDPKRIVIAGDSAGGNLALVTAMRIRDAALPPPGCVVLLSPSTDLTGASASLVYNRHRDPLLVPEALPFIRATYAPGVEASHPWLSPIHDDFAGLPPLLFHAGGTELIVDDSIRAAEKARAARVPVELEVWPGMAHVFQMMHVLPEARAAMAAIARFVRAHVPAPYRAAAEAQAGEPLPAS